MTNLICAQCAIPFFRKSGEHAKAIRKGKTRHFCSRECADTARATGDTTIELECGSCGSKFRRVLAEHRRNTNYGLRQAFCSRTCADRGRTVETGAILDAAAFHKERRDWESGSTLAERIDFYSRPMPNGCIEWTGTHHGKNGRPTLKVGLNTEFVARLVWIQHNGPIPEGVIIRHFKCRNVGCINIEHLADGSSRDNAADRERDGMTSRGEDHGMAKLLDWQVQEIRSSTDSLRVLAKRYRISKSQVQRIRAETSRMGPPK